MQVGGVFRGHCNTDCDSTCTWLTTLQVEVWWQSDVEL